MNAQLLLAKANFLKPVIEAKTKQEKAEALTAATENFFKNPVTGKEKIYSKSTIQKWIKELSQYEITFAVHDGTVIGRYDVEKHECTFNFAHFMLDNLNDILPADLVYIVTSEFTSYSEGLLREECHYWNGHIDSSDYSSTELEACLNEYFGTEVAEVTDEAGASEAEVDEADEADADADADEADEAAPQIMNDSDIIDNLVQQYPDMVWHKNEEGNISIIDIIGQSLTSIDELTPLLPHVAHLDVSDNELTELPETIGCATECQYFYVDDNQLTRLPSSIGNLENLFVFKAHSNLLTELPEAISHWKKLGSFEVPYNRLTKLPDSICELEKVSRMDLHRNQLTELPANFDSKHLKNLRVLDLRDNPFNKDYLQEIKRRFPKRVKIYTDFD